MWGELLISRADRAIHEQNVAAWRAAPLRSSTNIFISATGRRGPHRRGRRGTGRPGVAPPSRVQCEFSPVWTAARAAQKPPVAALPPRKSPAAAPPPPRKRGGREEIDWSGGLTSWSTGVSISRSMGRWTSVPNASTHRAVRAKNHVPGLKTRAPEEGPCVGHFIASHKKTTGPAGVPSLQSLIRRAC
ncbi:MAG: hypothetical protein GEEBNDBF_02591 [bacterium]|nr:hypothetical protein [bacterium]